MATLLCVVYLPFIAEPTPAQGGNMRQRSTKDIWCLNFMPFFSTAAPALTGKYYNAADTVFALRTGGPGCLR